MSAIAALPRDVFQLDKLTRRSRRLHASVMTAVIFLQEHTYSQAEQDYQTRHWLITDAVNHPSWTRHPHGNIW